MHDFYSIQSLRIPSVEAGLKKLSAQFTRFLKFQIKFFIPYFSIVVLFDKRTYEISNAVKIVQRSSLVISYLSDSSTVNFSLNLPWVFPHYCKEVSRLCEWIPSAANAIRKCTILAAKQAHTPFYHESPESWWKLTKDEKPLRFRKF